MPLEVAFEPSNLGKVRFMLIAEGSLRTMHQLGFTETDTDDVKGIFFDTGVVLLLVTVFVTSFHVSFWRSTSLASMYRIKSLNLTII